MNLREGTRRLALLLGVVGIIVGGFASYLFLQPALEQRARHNRFEQLANSDVVKQERRTLQATPDFIPDDPIQEFLSLPHDQQLSTLQQLSRDKQDKLLAKVKEYRLLAQFGQRIKAKYPEYQSVPDVELANKVIAKYPQYKSVIKSDTQAAPTRNAAVPKKFGTDVPVEPLDVGKTPSVVNDWQTVSPDDGWTVVSRKPAKTYLDDQGNPIPSPRPVAKGTSATQNAQSVPGFGPNDWKTVYPNDQVSKGGIKTIHWTKNLGVESIEAEDGQTIYPTPAPSAWQYLWVALFPIFGFVIPWGAVRAIGWVVAGFGAGSK